MSHPRHLNHKTLVADDRSGPNDAVRRDDGSSGDVPVLHVDEYLAVIDKPAGLAVHDSRLARSESAFLVDRLRAQFGRRVHPAHRLDRATSGCLLVAFDGTTAAALGGQLMSRTVAKRYLAVCRGWPAEEFTVDHPLDGGPGKKEKKPALTRFARLATVELDLPSEGFPTSRYALLGAVPGTGRYRQIRRHLKHVSHHLIGDTSHGDGRHNRNFRMLGVHRMLLHAWRLEFDHPHDGRRLAITAPPDADFSKALRLFGVEPECLA
jgi:tRNA pseudouridine65 synthase